MYSHPSDLLAVAFRSPNSLKVYHMSAPAILITGTAKFSLGDSFVRQYCSQPDHLPIITLDKNLNQELESHKKVNSIQINLNPLDHSGGHSSFENELKIALHDSVNQLSCDSISATVLSAGLYNSGPITEQTREIRKDLIGVNICGKYEVLHSVLLLNEKYGFDNRKGFTLVDIGSTHGLIPSRGRSLYAPSKAFGLNLCIALQDGEEVHRCIHIAPGPIDTYMLHKNYWVIKEQGPASFLDHLFLHHEELYHQIFVECCENALNEACTIQSVNIEDIIDTFASYKNRRQSKLQTEEGILQPKDVADLIVDIMLDDKGYPPGVYVVTAPMGRKRVERIPFSRFCFNICHT